MCLFVAASDVAKTHPIACETGARPVRDPSTAIGASWGAGDGKRIVAGATPPEPGRHGVYSF
jgi:hypothetical protein